MNNINTILDAVGELDNTVLENAFMPRRKKHIMLTAIAAAAALSLLVGFTTAIRSGAFFENRQQIDLKYYPQTQAHILTEEELVELGAIKDGLGRKLNAFPSELFALYNIEPVMNDEFFCEDANIIIYNSSATQTFFSYALIDNGSGKRLKIDLQFTQNGEGTFSPTYSIIGGGKVEEIFSHYETITLADGSEGFVADRYLNGFNIYTAEAVFCRDGIGYRLNTKNTDINEMKLMLKKLGVIAG